MPPTLAKYGPAGQQGDDDERQPMAAMPVDTAGVYSSSAVGSAGRPRLVAVGLFISGALLGLLAGGLLLGPSGGGPAGAVTSGSAAWGMAWGSASEANTAEIRQWFDQWGAHVAAREFAPARAQFSGDALGFGTWMDYIEGLDELESKQWRSVWPTIQNFHHETETSLRVTVSPDGLQAVGLVLWTSTGFGVDGEAFDRPGRTTAVFARKVATDGFVCIHTHVSLARGVPEQSFGEGGQVEEEWFAGLRRIPQTHEQAAANYAVNNPLQWNGQCAAFPLAECTEPECEWSGVTGMCEIGQADSHRMTALRLVAAAATDDAVCLDGSPATLYHRKGSGSGANRWFIHHQGGGAQSLPHQRDDMQIDQTGLHHLFGSSTTRAAVRSCHRWHHPSLVF